MLSDNKGCEALAYSALILLSTLCFKYKTDFEFYVQSHSIKRNENILKVGSEEISYKLIRNPDLFSLKGIIKAILKFPSTLKNLKTLWRSDVIFDLGEGDSFSDIYGKTRFESINLPSKLARLLRRPYIFLPQTIGPFENNSNLDDAQKSLKGARKVMARDSLSAHYASRLSGRNIEEYIDLAFLLPFKKINFSKKEIHVGLNVSGLLWNGGYEGKNDYNLHENYPDVIRQLINFLLEYDGRIRIHLISHVFGLTKDHVENDFSVLTDLYKEFNSERITLAPISFNPVDVKSYIAGMDLFLGARMHSAIAAFSSGVPVIPMAYSRKFNGLFKDTLGYPYLIDLTKDNIIEILDIAKRGIERRNDLRKNIDIINSTIVQDRINRLSTDIEAILFNENRENNK